MITKRTKGMIAVMVTAATLAMLFLPVIPAVGETAPQSLPLGANCSSVASALTSVSLAFGQINFSYQSPSSSVLLIGNVTGFSADSVAGSYSVQSFTLTGVNLTSGKHVLTAVGQGITLNVSGNSTYATIKLGITEFKFSASPAVSSLTSLDIYALNLNIVLNCRANTYQMQFAGVTNVATVITNIANRV